MGYQEFQQLIESCSFPREGPMTNSQHFLPLTGMFEESLQNLKKRSGCKLL